MVTKDRRKLQHIHSSIAGKQPRPEALEVGEIAVNNGVSGNSNTDCSFLSIKNANNKVVRFSSDSTIIDWIEKKEVMPYSGVVDNVHLDTNRSNIEIKINQVAAKNTPKYDKINGAVDIDGQPVNPSTDDGKTDGAGIAIDMSRYAMIGANPSFSSITVTDKSDLSGNTTIANGDGTGTRTGHTLAIKTTDVTANDTNWTETIANRTSTVTNETNKITTLNESATTRTTVVGTENLTVSGTTTENKVGNVVENNLSDKTESTAGVLIENNNSNHIVNTTGTTNITRTGVVTEDNKNNVTRTTSGSTTETFNGQVTENNQSGYTVNTTGNVIVNTTGTTTETKTGNVTENHSGTTTENYTGKWSVNVTSGTEITSCSSTTINTNKFKLTQCDGTSGTAEFDFCGGYKINTDKMEILQCSANGTMDVKEKAITVSGTSLGLTGTSLTIRESGATDFSGNTLTATTASNANINVKGNLTEVVTGTTNETHSGAVTINNGNTKTENTTGAVTENNNAGYTVNTIGDTCLQSTADVNVGGAANTNIGTNCDDSVKANYVNIKAKSGITETANTVTISGTTSASMSGATVNVSGGTTNINGATNLNLTGGSITEYSTATTCINAGTTAALVGATKTNIGKNCNDGGQTAILNINGNTINETGATINVTSSGKTCIQASTDLNIGGDATTNVGTNCAGGVYSNNVNIYAQTAITETANTVNISGTSTVNVSGSTVNVSGGSINETSTGKTCITAGGDLNIGGDTNTNVGYNCAGTGIANNTNIFASSAVTINAPKTNITGDTYLSGKTYFHKTCTSLTSNEIDAAFCEILNRGSITMTRDDNPSNSGLSAVYKLYQNGSQIGYDIDVPKDGFLKNVELVESASTYYLHFVWNIFDADTKTYTTGETYVNMENLVKDIDDRNPSDTGSAANHNVVVDVHYDATEKKMVVSAETTPTMHVTNMYATTNISGATVSGTNVNAGTLNVTGNTTLKATTATTINASTSVTSPTVSGTTVKGTTVNAGTLTASGNTTLAATTASSVSATSVSSPTISGTNITASAAMRANNVSANTISANTITGAMSKKLTWTSGTFTADTTGYNGSADKTITVPTAISHLPTRGKLTVTHNGLLETYDPASDKSMTLPHSALTWQYGSVTSASNGSYDTSSGKTVTIPKNLKHLVNDLSDLTIEYGSSSNRTGTSTYNGSAAVGTLYIPNTLSNVSNGVVSDSSAASTTAGQINITKNVSVTGTITASGAIYSSDRNLKENIFDISENEFERVGFVKYKTYNFKGEDNKMYGVIAQDLQDAGLGEMVYSRDDGTLAVDYTSLMILQLARLKRDNEVMLNHIAWLERRIEKLEGGNKE